MSPAAATTTLGGAATVGAPQPARNADARTPIPTPSVRRAAARSPRGARRWGDRHLRARAAPRSGRTGTRPARTDRARRGVGAAAPERAGDRMCGVASMARPIPAFPYRLPALAGVQRTGDTQGAHDHVEVNARRTHVAVRVGRRGIRGTFRCSNRQTG